ncbi:4-hydroxybenzoate octaprenyltransferase [Gallaecimonas xiamenensis]|uniref:4-hydroxybenzoate octaprenyltransferase n=1 Tax=Gallaecimonas xiamenensis 3-C-1 TaxID=745411 RepID=K2K3F5_9GAMM|nr:4-hydroxybenzoate octaprenyltransferase [Gallaecimonas xiamenensis]EKE77484.1 4-hydroxybenzoate octaprenyltransferase [Gallaecimonas xiamenensis 3-C-1]
MTETLHNYLRLMRADKPIGSLLLFWPTLWALLIAGEGYLDPWITTVFFAGVFLMRSAGCVINDFADRKVDGDVKRTAQRPLATGAVSSREALVLFTVLCLLSFALVLTLNSYTIKLSFVALGLAVLYPFMKRYTHLPQLVLGMAFGWGIPMAAAAQANRVDDAIWWLFAANICWTIAYDTFYAMVDRDDDLRIGVKSTAILFGRFDKLITGLLQLCTLLLLLKVGEVAALGLPYYLGVLAMAGLFVHQQWQIRNRERMACFKAFLDNNYAGMVVAVGLFADYLMH